ncbi:MAG: hypothetical protein KatS3mg108_0737 [Isosphaeraceae bacterium]|jgi:hypothetical protein|nr:MAG: hypothetical protein KatS3mg108_0737 [Isosphaeraceae bacterium]
MKEGSRQESSWLGSVPLYAGLLIGTVVSRLGVLDPVFRAVGGWLGFGDRVPSGGNHSDRPPPAAADSVTHPSRVGSVPDDLRAPAMPGGHKSARSR